MTAGEIALAVGQLLLVLVAFMGIMWLLAFIIESCKKDLEERREEKRKSRAPAPDDETQAVSAATDLAGKQAETKVRAHLAFQEELKQMREDRWEP